MSATQAALLARRERRQAEQVALLRATGLPLISLTVVSPGPEKHGPAAASAFAAASAEVDALLERRRWPQRSARQSGGDAGPERLVAVAAPAEGLKRALVDLEESHPLGRLWDLDVVTGPGRHGLPVVLGRRELGLPTRRCLVCAGDAAACGRSAAHPLPVVLAFRDAIAARLPVDAARAASELAVRALLIEARLTPKPGLVDAASTGAHDDMDLSLLERSAESLRDWLAASWLLGALRPDPDALRPELLDLGRRAEASMLRATGGVNTHRGALFCLGLALAAHGRLVAAAGAPAVTRPPIGALAEGVAALAEPLLVEWVAGRGGGGSHGADAYRRLGLTGARGEAASGFATVRRVGLPALAERRAETGDDDDALRWALARLMADNADTNLVARGGAEGLAAVRAWASGLVGRRPDPQQLVAAFAAAEPWFVARRYSPGGSADLLALTWLLPRLCS